MTVVESELIDGEYYGHARTELFPFVPDTTKRLLDVGCAGGTFGAGLMKARPSVEVWGIEPVSRAANRARERLTRVICSSVEPALSQLPDGHFDCITFNDVLEHLVDPWVLLRDIQAKLTPDGVIVASIPNMRHYPVMKSLLIDGDFHYVDDGILDRTHLRFFTRKSMRRLFNDCGLTVTRIEGLRWQRLPVVLALINRLVGGALGDMCFLQFALQGKPSSSM